jgi:hypothetical protein
MPKGKKILLLIIVFSMAGLARTSGKSRGQLYEWSLGVRAGTPLQISAKHFLNKGLCLEGMLGYYSFNSEIHWRMAGAALQFHFPFPESRNLTFYAGGGFSVHNWVWKHSINGRAYPKTVFGAFTQVGVEYKMKKVPLALSVDWMPIYQAAGYDQGLGIAYGAIGIRFILR